MLCPLQLRNTLRFFVFVFDVVVVDDKFVYVVLLTKQALMLRNVCIMLISIYLSSLLVSNASMVPLSITRSNVGPYSCCTSDKSRMSATAQCICDHLPFCALAQNVLSMRCLSRYRYFILVITTYE